MATHICAEVTLEGATSSKSVHLIKDGQKYWLSAYFNCSTMGEDEWERIYSMHYESFIPAWDKFSHLVQEYEDELA